MAHPHHVQYARLMASQARCRYEGQTVILTPDPNPDDLNNDLYNDLNEGADDPLHRDMQQSDALYHSVAYADPLLGNQLPSDTLYPDLLHTDPSAQPPEPDDGPSLPIILISAACGVAGGIFGLYISYVLLDFGTTISAGLATLGLLFGLGVSGAALTAATGERGAIINMAFSCTLIVLVVLFMAMCAMAGATVATLLLKS